MKKIETIWKDLEASATKGGGILYRRYSADILPQLFVAIRRLNLNRCLALVFSDREAARKIEKESMKGLEFEVQENSAFPHQYLLLIVLSDRKNEDVFATLAEDLIGVVAKQSSEAKVIGLIHHRVLIWKSLFDETLGNGLSLESQLGLFAELYFLQSMITSSQKPIADVMESWVGPTAANRDFELGGWAAEVKGTRANQHQKVTIHNERQLDNTHLEKLFLCCYAFDVQKSTTPSLNDQVESLRSLLEMHPVECTSFERKLILAGYMAQHRYLYDEHGFILRYSGFYRVGDGFPCIREQDVPSGVGNVTYTIMLSSLSAFAIEFDNLFT
jgi:hypothetical protein